MIQFLLGVLVGGLFVAFACVLYLCHFPQESDDLAERIKRWWKTTR